LGEQRDELALVHVQVNPPQDLQEVVARFDAGELEHPSLRTVGTWTQRM
jgi:hypothetical protein